MRGAILAQPVVVAVVAIPAGSPPAVRPRAVTPALGPVFGRAGVEGMF